MKPLTVASIALCYGSLLATIVTFDATPFRIVLMALLVLLLGYWIWIAVGENRKRRNMQNLIDLMGQRIIEARNKP